MATRPILFSAPMVKGLLDGRKTQTRRILTRRNVEVLGASWAGKSHPWEGLRFAEAWVRERSPISGQPDCHLSVPFCHPDDEPTPTDECGIYRISSAIEVGDRLWVREAWTHTGVGVWSINDARMSGRGGVRYQADGPIVGEGGYWPSIHMPREFSRITLKVTAVTIERLNDISAVDAELEGVKCDMSPRTFIDHFRILWESINGPGSWAANPWVIAIAFAVIRENVGRVAA